MSFFKSIQPKIDLRNNLVEQNDFGEEFVFCKRNNLEQSLCILNEEFESFGIPSTVNNNLQDAESLKELSVQMANAAWKLINKYRHLMRLHEKSIELNHKTVNDNANLKNHVKHLKEDLQKKEHTIYKIEERERRLNVKNEDALRDLKQKKEEILKLKKQAQFKETQHEHEIRRITQNTQKLQEQFKKSAGSYTLRDKLLQKTYEKEITTYKQTICRLEENNRHMLKEINNLKEVLDLHQIGVNLHMETSGAWTNANV